MTGLAGLAGTGALVRLIVARDKVRMLAWLGGILLLVVATASSTKGIYPTQADLDEAAAVALANPVALAFNGPDQALDTIGGQVAFQIGAFGLLVVGLMSLLLLGRLTRGEEDSGRLELVRSMPVGRQAPLAAGLLVVTAANVVLGALTAAVLVAQDLPVAGSVLFGAAFGAFGIAFVGVTAVTAQVTENPRVTGGLAGGVLFAAFVLRAVGDVGTGALSWASPMGWAQRARPYAGERWWPVALLLVVAAGLVAGAAALAARRDFGAGLVAPRRGPAAAAPSLRGPVGLAARLGRGAVLWWGVATLSLGLTYGSLADAIEEFVSDNEALLDVLAAYGDASLVDSYLATSLLIMALLAAGPGIQIAARLRSEEAGQRAEPILAAPASRSAWMRSHLAAALAGSAVSLAVGGLGLGATYAATGGGWRQVPRLTAAALVYAPAVWVLVAVAAALFGLAPRWTAGAWVALAVCFVIAMFGPLLDLPAWLVGLSPFQRTPAVPADPLRAAPPVALAALAAGLVAAGLAGFRARDLASA